MNERYLESFLAEYGFCEGAVNATLAVRAQVEDSPCLLAKIRKARQLLFAEPQDAKAIEQLFCEVADSLSLSKYTVALYALAEATEQLRDSFLEMKLPEMVIYDTLSDLYIKCEECYGLTGVYGIYSIGWIIGWFRCKRFTFGRLQFELAAITAENLSVGGVTLKVGDGAIAVHIPRSEKPFTPEARLESYKMAYEYFAKYFESDKIPFTCNSWLLFPYNKQILSPTSNTVSFADEFKLVSTSFGEVWIRFIFGVIYDGNPDNLPETSRLQRSYKSYIKEGNQTGSGYGVFLFDGEKIIND